MPKSKPKKKITLQSKIKKMFTLARRNKYYVDTRFRCRANREIIEELKRIDSSLLDREISVPSRVSGSTTATTLGAIIPKLLGYKSVVRPASVRMNTDRITELVRVPSAREMRKARNRDIAKYKTTRLDCIKNLHLVLNEVNELVKSGGTNKEAVADLLSIIDGTVNKAIVRLADLREKEHGLRLQRAYQKICKQHRRKSTLGQSRHTPGMGDSVWSEGRAVERKPEDARPLPGSSGAEGDPVGDEYSSDFDDDEPAKDGGAGSVSTVDQARDGAEIHQAVEGEPQFAPIGTPTVMVVENINDVILGLPEDPALEGEAGRRDSRSQVSTPDSQRSVSPEKLNLATSDLARSASARSAGRSSTGSGH